MNAPAPVKVKTTGQWWVEVQGQVYGPYTMGQLSRFVIEGRIRATTRVSENKESGWVEARQVIGLMAPARTDAANENAADGANVFVHAEIRSEAWHAFMATLESLGSLCELAPGLWLVRTRHSAGAMRNTLSQTLESGDRFVVIDATRDRFAWFNLGAEVDVRVAKVWNVPLGPRPLDL